MKKVILSFILFAISAFTSVCYSQYGLSDAIITGTGNGSNITFTDPHTNNTRTANARLMNGTVDGNATKFYCIDIQRTLSFPDSCHKDSAVANSKIVYVLNNYYPYNQTPVGKLPNLNYEVDLNVATNSYLDGELVYTLTSNNVSNNGTVISSTSQAVSIPTGATKVLLGKAN